MKYLYPIFLVSIALSLLASEFVMRLKDNKDLQKQIDDNAKAQLQSDIANNNANIKYISQHDCKMFNDRQNYKTIYNGEIMLVPNTHYQFFTCPGVDTVLWIDLDLLNK